MHVYLYIFDKKLRLLVLDALETIEISIRVDTVHTLGEIDPLAYKKRTIFAEVFTKKPQHNPLQDKRSGDPDKQIDRSKYGERLGDHYKPILRSDDELDQTLPGKIWCETTTDLDGVWDLGFWLLIETVWWWWYEAGASTPYLTKVWVEQRSRVC